MISGGKTALLWRGLDAFGAFAASFFYSALAVIVHRDFFANSPAWGEGIAWQLKILSSHEAGKDHRLIWTVATTPKEPMDWQF